MKRYVECEYVLAAVKILYNLRDIEIDGDSPDGVLAIEVVLHELIHDIESVGIGRTVGISDSVCSILKLQVEVYLQIVLVSGDMSYKKYCEELIKKFS